MGVVGDEETPEWWQGSNEEILSRLEDVRLQMEQQKRESSERIAATPNLAGIQLIPSDDLKDNQYIVSRAVYDAAMRLASKVGAE